MRKWREDILTNAAIIKAAFPRDSAKLIARALGCSDRQGKSIASGRVPGRFRSALIGLLQSAIAQNKAQLDRIDDELKRLDYEEMVARASARREAAAGDRAPALPGLAQRSAEPHAVAAPVASPAARGGRT